VIFVFMALLSFLESTPQAYGLKVSNAAPPFSTAAGTSPNTLVVDVTNFSPKVGGPLGHSTPDEP